MNKRHFFAAALGAAFTRRTARAAEAPFITEPGAIAAQVIGRINIGADAITEVALYFAFIDGLGGDLFNGESSEKTAHFTLRTDRLRTLVTLNGDAAHLTFQPEGESGLYHVYYDPSASSRSFTSPGTFSQGTKIAAFKSRRTQTTLVPGSHGLVTGTADVVESSVMNYRDVAYNIADLFNSITFTFHTKAFSITAAGIPAVSIPFAGHLIKVS